MHFELMLATGGSRLLFMFVAIVAFFVLMLFLTVVRNFPIWLRARNAGAPVRQLNLMGMRFRKVDPNVIVNARIHAVKAGLDLTAHQLESHFLASGDPQRVVKGLIIARKEGVDMSFNTACALDLAGVDHRDSSEMAKSGIDPGAIECMKVAGET